MDRLARSIRLSVAFVSVAGITFSVGQLITGHNRVQRRSARRRKDMRKSFTLASGDAASALSGRAF